MKSPERNLLVAHIRKALQENAWELPEGTRVIVGRRRYLKLKKALGENPSVQLDDRVFPIIEDRSLSEETVRFATE
jgi:proline dehydrogenase